MINIKELRIGNLLWPIHLGNTAEVVGIGVDRIEIKNLENRNEWSTISKPNLHRLEPIPLTEEWLIKFGFIKMVGGVMAKMFRIRLTDSSKLAIVIDVDKSINTYIEIYKEIQVLGFEAMYIENIEHVHQLQNLYFALAREELVYDN